MVPSPPVPHHGCLCLFTCGWGRNIADKVCRVSVLLQNSCKVVNFLLKVVLCADDLAEPVVETSYHTTLHVGQMMKLEVEILVRVCGLPVDRLPSSLLLSCVSRNGSVPSFCHSTVNLMVFLTLLRWCRSSSVEPLLRMQKVSSTYLLHSLGLVGAVSSASSSCRGWSPQQRPGSPLPHFPSAHRSFLHSRSRWTSGTSPVALQSILETGPFSPQLYCLNRMEGSACSSHWKPRYFQCGEKGMVYPCVATLEA